jgi:hypothetical protein
MSKDDSFKRLRALIKSMPKGKATAEADASKNPMKYLKDHQNMSFKGIKGIAF